MKRLLAILLICSFAWAEDVPPTREENLAVVEKTLEANQRKYGKNEDFFVRRGLIADRKKQIITIQAETTGIKAKEIAEFFIIDEKSGHAYESISIAFCKPGDVKAALEFLGMEPGRGINLRKHEIWPKGERVIVHIDGKRAEDYVYDEESGKALPSSGFVFIGSRMVPDMENDGKPMFAADNRGPGSIAANYNEKDSILDVPRSAPQRTMYGNNLVVEKHVIPMGKFIEITIEPEYKDGKKRVLDLRVEIMSDKEDASGVSCKVAGKDYSTSGLMKYLRKLLQDGHDPFVTLDFDDGLTIGALKKFEMALVMLDTNDGIRLEPPVEGQIYHRAFNPPAHFLDRKNRIQHPLELFLERKDGQLVATLKQYSSEWKDGSTETTVSEKEFPVQDPAALLSAMEKVENQLSVLFVHGPSDLTHAELMNYAEPVIPTHPVIQVFTSD